MVKCWSAQGQGCHFTTMVKYLSVKGQRGLIGTIMSFSGNAKILICSKVSCNDNDILLVCLCLKVTMVTVCMFCVKRICSDNSKLLICSRSSCVLQ